MPLNLGSANHCRDLSCVKTEDLLVISPTNLPPMESARQSARETLRQCDDVAAVIVLHEASLLAQFFEEAWNMLPGRLASLAVCPPAATFVVTRANNSARLLRYASDTGDALWRCLVEIARVGSRIEVQTKLSDEFFDPTISVDGGNARSATWLPELLSAPPRSERDWLFGELRLARLSDLCGSVASPADATAVLAGLWLLHGDGDTSHRHSQTIEDEGRHRCGNFWHAIVHRQEPDYGNAKYWFRRVGPHPILPELARYANELILASGLSNALAQRQKLGLPQRWDTLAFVNWCEAATRIGNPADLDLLRRIQFIEMHLLLRASFADATQP